MFRKPKKKPTALRNSGGGVDSSSGPANNQSRKRRRQYDSSDDEEDRHNNTNDDNDATTTSELLEQIRQERTNDSTANKSKKPLLNTASTNNNTSKKKAGGMMHQFKSNNDEIQLSAKDMATRTAEYHPANNNVGGSNSTINNINDNGETTNDKDKNATLPSLQKQPRNKFLAGPLKATTFVRTTARFDYQPDICKDYKETGFCGFGDTCIYLHDRGDTKSGWEMEQEYEGKKKAEEERKGREMERFMKSMMCGEVGAGTGGSGGGVKGDNNLDDDKKDNIVDDGIPFACHICRGPFRNPVVTTCGHYFCESCMQSRIRGDITNDGGGGGGGTTGCPICQKDTHGVLNHPQKLVAKKRRLVGRDGTWEDYLNKK